jgi:hypothetical protein
MNIIKSPVRSQLINENLNAAVRIALSQEFEPNFDSLVEKKKIQISKYGCLEEL